VTGASGQGVTRFVARGAHRLSYEASTDAAGMPILALHDLLADRGQWRPLREALAPPTYRLLLPDARGHGASAAISGAAYPPGELAADVLAILDTEGVAAAHVVAAGWAAQTALALSTGASQRVLSLIIVEPYLPSFLADHPDPAVQQGAAAHLDLVREATIAAKKGQADKALDLFLGARLGAGWREAFAKPRLGAIRRAAANLGPLLSGTTAEPVDRGALGAVQTPIALLLGQGAPALEQHSAEALALLLPLGWGQVEPIATGSDSLAAVAAAVARSLAAQSS
jgi:pimeloyl-ACP methyl ester carboxylesterase